MGTDDSLKSGIYSHPFVFIEDHINRCLELAQFFAQKSAPLLNEDFKKALLLAVVLHDFGKTTSYFQDYMKSVMEGGKYKKEFFKNRSLSEHALLGGVYAYQKAKQIFKDDKLSFFIYVACKRHHTNLNNFTSEAEELADEDIKEFLIKQIDAIDEERANIFLRNLNLPYEIKKAIYFDAYEFKSNLKETLKGIVRFRRELRKCKHTIGDFIRFQYLFSLLLDADKTEAGAKPYKPERETNLGFDVVEEYKKENLTVKTHIDRLREEAYKEALSSGIDLSKKLYSITLPTGMGKTLTGFAFALKLREEIYKKHGVLPRIIYSLPFLSIIDQNADVLRDVFSIKHKVKSSLLLKHHHLSDKSYDEFEYTVSRVLSEGWNSEVIITTFVQLFQTLLSWKNSSSRRFNKLANSILLIDEVQALPHQYWMLIRDMLKEISRELNTYIILMTATQPYLLEETKELTHKEKYFNALDRVSFKTDLEPKTTEEFLEKIHLEPKKSYLFIANTIKSSIELYSRLKERLDEPVCYLSTNIVPSQRRERIEDIKRKKYRIAVSTQLVEAGVDIDFDVVFRDFAPLDSLIQSAGRCNRNMEKGKGEFLIVKLIDQEGKPFYNYVYDGVLTHTTEKILDGKKELSEPQFVYLCEEYFRKLWGIISHDTSRDIKSAIECFRFSGEKREDIKHISDFRLIEDEPYKKDVFIELSDEATEVWKEAKGIIRDLKSRKIDIFEAKEHFEKLKPRFYDFVISVDTRKNPPLIDEELNIGFVSKDMLESFYDEETGFKTDGKSYEVL